MFTMHKVRPRFDGDRVYVHDSIVLTVIGGNSHVTGGTLAVHQIFLDGHDTAALFLFKTRILEALDALLILGWDAVIVLFADS